jgi:hypothetical protein
MAGSRELYSWVESNKGEGSSAKYTKPFSSIRWVYAHRLPWYRSVSEGAGQTMSSNTQKIRELCESFGVFQANSEHVVLSRDEMKALKPYLDLTEKGTYYDQTARLGLPLILVLHYGITIPENGVSIYMLRGPE